MWSESQSIICKYLLLLTPITYLLVTYALISTLPRAARACDQRYGMAKLKWMEKRLSMNKSSTRYEEVDGIVTSNLYCWSLLLDFVIDEHFFALWLIKRLTNTFFAVILSPIYATIDEHFSWVQKSLLQLSKVKGSTVCQPSGLLWCWEKSCFTSYRTRLDATRLHHSSSR